MSASWHQEGHTVTESLHSPLFQGDKQLTQVNVENGVKTVCMLGSECCAPNTFR